MIESIDRFFPPGTKGSSPTVALHLGECREISTHGMLAESLADPDVRVAFVAGEVSSLRKRDGQKLHEDHFGSVTPEKIRTGAERLGKLIRQKLNANLEFVPRLSLFGG